MWLSNLIADMWDWVLNFWGNGLTQIQAIMTTSPESFAEGSPWRMVIAIFNSLEATGYALLIICFYIGLTKSTITFMDMKRPAVAVTVLLRFFIVKVLIGSGMGFVQKIMSIGQGLTSLVFSAGIGGDAMRLPDEVRSAISSAGFVEKLLLFFVTLLAVVVIVVMTFTVIYMVYSRFFKIYLGAAISPIPLAFFGGEPTQSVGISYLKAFGGVCMEGVITAIACVIYSALVTSLPTPSGGGSGVMMMLLQYIVTLIFHTLLLAGIVKGSDQLAQKYLGL